MRPRSSGVQFRSGRCPVRPLPTANHPTRYCYFSPKSWQQIQTCSSGFRIAGVTRVRAGSHAGVFAAVHLRSPRRALAANILYSDRAGRCPCFSMYLVVFKAKWRNREHVRMSQRGRKKHATAASTNHVILQSHRPYVADILTRTRIPAQLPAVGLGDYQWGRVHRPHERSALAVRVWLWRRSLVT